MKKAFSLMMAGAMVASMSVAAFAANPAQSSVVYNSSGNKNSDVYADEASLARNYMGDINIDGVVPNAEFYIPLGASMDSIMTDSTITGESTDPQASHYYNKDAATMQTEYSTAETAETTTNKNNAFASITGSAIDWAAVTTGHTTDATAKYYYAAQSGANELTEVIDFTTEPTGTNYYFDAAAKAAYDSQLTTEQANDEANILSAISASNEVTGADAWKDAAVKSYYKSSSFTDYVYNAGTVNTGSYKVSLDSLTDGDLFKFDLDKDEGSKYVDDVDLVMDKKLGSLDRTAYLKFTLNDSTTTSDLKSTGSISFKAKKSSDDAKVSGESWADNKEFTINYTLWINNLKAANDDNIGTGDRVYFDPDSNEDNVLVWGDDRAALFFEGNDDASKFYARLQTRADAEIYREYGDPVNADLWFYDFVGNPTIPSTSRATLTLGIPWDEDDDYTPDPEDCYIYEKDADGYLTDVTDRFTYSEDNDGSTDIEGWTIKTRTLGTYVISDTELDTTVVEEVDEEEVEENDDEDTSSNTNGGKEIPNTGSSDMVGAAVVAAIASLAVAGAAAFKKASK